MYHLTSSRLGVPINEFLELPERVQNFHLEAESELNRERRFQWEQW